MFVARDGAESMYTPPSIFGTLPLGSARHPRAGMDYCPRFQKLRSVDQSVRLSKRAIRKGMDHHLGEGQPSDHQSCSLRAFLRLRLRARASLTRFFSPGFR